MGEGRPRFRRERAPSRRGWLAGWMVLLGLVTAGVLTRPLWEPSAPQGVLVEVRGAVPRPGVHALPQATVRAAIEAAGADGAGIADRPLSAGDRVELAADGTITVLPASDPLLVALPVDLNLSPVEAIEALPDIGSATAAAIVADRARRGPFYEVADLGRVRGIGSAAVARVAPFVTVGDVGPRPPPVPLDLNTATATELERLPGIGPVLAARIVVERHDGGPYATVDDLIRVSGVGPATVARLRDRVTAGSP